MELMAASIAGLWSDWLWPIIQLIIGLGLVIFVHELGHFLVAKWVGIKVERFALGFGPRLAGFKRGETDYCVNLLPLGGYVKMLGQEDFKPVQGQQADPRAFNNKSVAARFAVVSAGVIMNVILAAVLFVIVCLVGIRQPAPVIGGVMVGSPAANAEITWVGAEPPSPATSPTTGIASGPTSSPSQPAGTTKPVWRGLQAGDRIIAIDGQPVPNFQKLPIKAMLASRDQVFQMTIEREVEGTAYVGLARVGVAEISSDGVPHLAFGVVSAADTIIQEAKSQPQFQKGDRVLAIDGKSVPHYWSIERIEKSLDGRPVTVTVDRQGQRVDVEVQPWVLGGDVGDMVVLKGSRLYGKILRKDENEVAIRLEGGEEKALARKDVSRIGEDELLDILGMIPRVQVESVSDGSPADKAGLEPGDIIVGYGDRGAPAVRQLHQVNEQFAGSGTNIIVSRKGQTAGPFWIVPKRRDGEELIGISPGVDQAGTVVAGVRPASAAAAAGIQPGDVIEAVDGTAVKNWNDVFIALKQVRSAQVTISVRRNVQRTDAVIADFGKQVFDAAKYNVRVFHGVGFRILEVAVVKTNPLAAVSWGVGETWDFLVLSYTSIRRLMQRTVSTKEFIGPVGIGAFAIKVGRESMIQFIYFMAMISVSLAVMNFLPIPVVDGGIAVFLLIEKVRGRPVPLRIMNAVQMVGLALLVLVFVALTWQDIARLVRNAW